MNILAPAMKAAFKEWAMSSKGYRKIYLDEKKWTLGCHQLTDILLSELKTYKPGECEHWIFLKQLRLKEFKAGEVNLVRELMYHFLGAYCTNKLGDVRESVKRRTVTSGRKGKTENSSETETRSKATN